MGVSDLMSRKVASVEMDDQVGVVKAIFEQGYFHHLVVVEDGKVVGMLTDRDLLKVLSPNLGTVRETEKDLSCLESKVHQIMSRDVITIQKQASVRHAIGLFYHNKVTCLPVVDDDQRLVGILTWRDIFKALAESQPGGAG